MQTHSKRDSACFLFILLTVTCGAAAQSSTVSSSVDGSISTSPPATAAGQAPDSGVSGTVGGSGGSGAGSGLFGAGGQAFNAALQGVQQTAPSGLITKAAGDSSSHGNSTNKSRLALQAGMATQPKTLPASYAPTVLPHGSGDAGGEYSTSFPDSVKGRAVLSPLSGANDALFGFSTNVGTNFTDLSQAQFLDPQLHVHMLSNSKKKQDLIQKLESRRKSKLARRDSIFGRKKKTPFTKQSEFQKQQQELKGDSSLDDRNF